MQSLSEIRHFDLVQFPVGEDSPPTGSLNAYLRQLHLLHSEAGNIAFSYSL